MSEYSDKPWFKAIAHVEQLEKENAELKEASLKVGFWLSAALDDDKTCEEMKKDIRIFFNALIIKEQGDE